MMKKKLLFLSVLLFLTFPATSVHAAAPSSVPLNVRLAGRIVLQVESYGRAWYIEPLTSTRYYLKNGETAYQLMRTLGLGISSSNLATIPTDTEPTRQTILGSRLAGRILLDVEQNGEAWYVNPLDGRRTYLKDGTAAYELMRAKALGIKNTDLATIPTSPNQLVPDTAFNSVAYAKVVNGTLLTGSDAQHRLPPASMTKLLTALVLIDHGIASKWDDTVAVTQFHLSYPISVVGDDTTSEVNLKVGDVLTKRDLWWAMLIASSNQATIALVDSSGLTRNEFIAAMNAKIKQLGLTQSEFFDPTGLSAENVTTPYEMALIAEAAFANADIAAPSNTGTYIINTQNAPSRKITVADRNYSLRTYGAEAAKTGFLVEAQRCVSLKVNGSIIVIMHARSMTERNTILTQLTKQL
ncbi:MAG: serine hydrolase [Patescibacteria group bacterium]